MKPQDTSEQRPVLMAHFGSSRVEAEHEGSRFATYDGGEISPEGAKVVEKKLKRGVTQKKVKTFKARVLSRVFAEDYDGEKNRILDPKGRTVYRWNQIFLAACLVSLFVDPVFCFLPIISGETCVDIASIFRIILTVIRSVADVFYVLQIFAKFHIAYVAPSSRLLGRGELVVDSSKIALRYLRTGFLLDTVAALPIPQVLVWFIIPRLVNWGVMHSQNAVWSLILIQYVVRVALVFMLQSQIAQAADLMTRKAWAGAAYNLSLYLLGAHVWGSAYYILTLQRQEDCWRAYCKLEKPDCSDEFFDCRLVGDPLRIEWYASTNVTNQCTGANNYAYGIHGRAVQLNIGSSAFMNRYFYCLWWGLKNLSTTGQNLVSSIRVGENVFITMVGISGLILLALLIGNVQRYLFSTTKQLEEWKIKRANTEQWMHQRQLPGELRQIVRNYDRYKWLATSGVDEEALVKGLPLDLQRKVRRHLCFDLLRQVPLFGEMDETMLDALCERLKPALCTKDMCIVREGDPVNQMLFVIRGQLDSYSNDGSADSSQLGPGDFCGEELLTWALYRRPNMFLPSSTRTIKAINEVEALALTTQDLKFMAAQFRKLHSKQLRHKFKYHSHRWRTWAASTIQLGWRRCRKLKETGSVPPPDSFWNAFAECLVASTRWINKKKQIGSDSGWSSSSIEKPDEPNFSDDEDGLDMIMKLA